MKTLTVVLVILLFAVLWLHDVRGVNECLENSGSKLSKTTDTNKTTEILYSSNQISNDTWIKNQTRQTLHKSCVWLSRNEICPK